MSVKWKHRWQKAVDGKHECKSCGLVRVYTETCLGERVIYVKPTAGYPHPHPCKADKLQKGATTP